MYLSPVSGGGYTKANNALVNVTSFTVNGLTDAQTYYFVVKAVDSVGNESNASNEVSSIPHLIIGWANLQWPPTLTHTISATTRTDNIYGQIFIDGATNKPGPTPGVQAQVGFGPVGSKPAGNPSWTWVTSTFNGDAGNNDEFVGTLQPTSVGTFSYAYRYSTTLRDWTYADLNGPENGDAPLPNPGKLTVNSSGDNTPPTTPTGLIVNSSSTASIDLSWNAVTGDPTLYGYQVLRSTTNVVPTLKSPLQPPTHTPINPYLQYHVLLRGAGGG